MKKIELKKPAIYGISAGVCALLLAALYYVDFSQSNLAKEEKEDLQYVSRLFGSDEIPVVSNAGVVIRPYTDDTVKIVQNFYNYKGSEKDQENSIINYEQTYMQNNGIAYGGIKNPFDVVCALSGTVTNVSEDKILGNVIEIKASDKVTIIYQSLDTVNFKVNDQINQGDIIGKSGKSNINKELGNHVVFEMKLNGAYVNPEEYYDKNINEL